MSKGSISNMLKRFTKKQAGRFDTGGMKHIALIGFDVNSIRASTKSIDGDTSSLNAYNPEYGNFETPDLSSLNPDINPETKKFKYYGITLQDQTFDQREGLLRMRGRLKKDGRRAALKRFSE